MSGPRILIVKGNPPDLIAAQGYCAADQFVAAFDALKISADCYAVEPYATNFEKSSLGQVDGLAKGIRKTEAGKSHPALSGRADIFVVPCIHCGEVGHLPKGAVHLVENDNSSMRSIAYRTESIDSLRARYYPVCPANAIANSLIKFGGRVCAVLTIIADFKVGGSDFKAAVRLGKTCDALHPEDHGRKLANWLIHVKDRISS